MANGVAVVLSKFKVNEKSIVDVKVYCLTDYVLAKLEKFSTSKVRFLMIRYFQYRKQIEWINVGVPVELNEKNKLC